MTNTERIADNQRMWEIMRVICSEFKTDPTSVQCFDLRIVHEAIELVERHEYPLHLADDDGHSCR
jgi:hypothetical protein